MSIGIWLLNLMARLFSEDMDGPLVLLDTIFSRFAMSSSFLPMFSEFWLILESRAFIPSVLLSRTVLKLATLSDRLPTFSVIFSSFFSMASLLFARLVWRIVISILLSSILSLRRVSFYADKKKSYLNDNSLIVYWENMVGS